MGAITIARLKHYIFTKGFAVVTISGYQVKGRMQFGCIMGSLKKLRT